MHPAGIFHTAHEKEGFRYNILSLRIDSLLTLVPFVVGFYFSDENMPDGSFANADWGDTAHTVAYWGALPSNWSGELELRSRSEVTPWVNVNRVSTACGYAHRQLYLHALEPFNRLTNGM